MKTIILIALIFVPLAVLARLGETKDEIYQRYGAVKSRTDISTNKWAAYYIFKDYHVRVEFDDDKSAFELVWHINGDKITDDEARKLMSDIGSASDWKKDEGQSDSDATVWRSASTGEMAVFTSSIEDSKLVVCTHDWWAAYGKKVEEDQKKRADGF